MLTLFSFIKNRCKDELICSPDTGQTRSSAIKESIMGKFNQSLVEKIAELIEEDNYTITEICGIVGISRKVFYEWKATKPSFAEALDQAVEAREKKTKSPPVDGGRSWKDTGR